MASLGHIAVGLTAARLQPTTAPSGRRWLLAAAAWSALSMLPDADVVGFGFGVRYEDEWGHRGATHSFVFSVIVGTLIGLAASRFKLPALRTGITASLVLVSHALLDTMTTGGLGCALFWPFDPTRYFAPWRPIPVAPIGLSFISPYGMMVASIELLLFAPLLWFGLARHGTRLRPLLAAALGVVWLAASWVLTSQGAMRDRVLGVLLREDTEFAPGFSEALLDSVQTGDAQQDVVARLGRPQVEVLAYDSRTSPGCAAVFIDGGAVVGMQPEDGCGTRGIRTNLSREAATEILGEPAEVCDLYSRSPGGRYYRVRAVCYEDGRVSNIVRQWYRN
jgi:inner membrane protein